MQGNADVNKITCTENNGFETEYKSEVEMIGFASANIWPEENE